MTMILFRCQLSKACPLLVGVPRNPQKSKGKGTGQRQVLGPESGWVECHPTICDLDLIERLSKSCEGFNRRHASWSTLAKGFSYALRRFWHRDFSRLTTHVALSFGQIMLSVLPQSPGSGDEPRRFHGCSQHDPFQTGCLCEESCL